MSLRERDKNELTKIFSHAMYRHGHSGLTVGEETEVEVEGAVVKMLRVAQAVPGRK